MKTSIQGKIWRRTAYHLLGICAFIRPATGTFSFFSVATFFLLKKTLGLKLLIAVKLLLMLGSGSFSTAAYRSYQEATLPFMTGGQMYSPTGPHKGMLFNIADLQDDSQELSGKTSRDQMVIENVLVFIKWLDEKNCVNRLLCDVGADKDWSSYGKYGKNFSEFFGTFEEAPEGSVMYDYVQALKVGRLIGAKICTEQFSACPHDMRNVVSNINYLYPDGQGF